MSEPTPAMPLLLAEDLLLLLLDDDVGTLRQTNLQPLLGGAVLAELALLGAVEVEEKRGIWQTARVRPVPGRRPEDPVRGLSPDPRTVALVALLSAVDQAHRVVPGEGLSGREVRKRAKQLVAEMDEGEWAAKAVRDAVRAATTAVTAGVVAGGSGDSSS